MPSKTAQKALAIFFLVFGVGLAIFILTQGISLFTASSGYVKSTGAPSVDCIKYFYEVGAIAYNAGELSFTIRNLDYSMDMASITVESDSPQVLPLQLPAGSSQQVRLAAQLSTNFSVYPSGCSVYKLICVIGTGKCAST